VTVPDADASHHLELVGDRVKNDAAYDVNSSQIQALDWRPRVLFDDGVRCAVEWYLAHPQHWRNIDQALLPHNADVPTMA